MTNNKKIYESLKEEMMMEEAIASATLAKEGMANNKLGWEGQIRILANYAFDREGELLESEFQKLVDFIYSLLSAERQKVLEELIEFAQVQNKDITINQLKGILKKEGE